VAPGTQSEKCSGSTCISLVSWEQVGLLRPAPGRPVDPVAALWASCAER